MKALENKRMVRRVLSRTPRSLKRILFRGNARLCSVCDSRLRSFFPYSFSPVAPVRPNAWCPVCGLLERHRLIWEFFRRRTDLFDGTAKRVLHIAPEVELAERLMTVPGLDYLTADLDDPRAMVRMDITDIQFGDGEFSVVLCSHVLEHVPDDLKAMREFRRILAPGGWVCIMVPVFDGSTFEDPSVIDPAERERIFGQRDHVRRYGLDIADRLASAGFIVTTLRGADIVGADSIERYGIPADEPLFLCRPA